MINNKKGPAAKSVVDTTKDTEPQENDAIWKVVTYQVVDWLYVDDVCGASEAYALSNNCNSIHWNYMQLFTRTLTSTLFQRLFQLLSFSLLPYFHDSKTNVNFSSLDTVSILYHCVIVD